MRALNSTTKLCVSVEPTKLIYREWVCAHKRYVICVYSTWLLNMCILLLSRRLVDCVKRILPSLFHFQSTWHLCFSIALVCVCSPFCFFFFCLDLVHWGIFTLTINCERKREKISNKITPSYTVFNFNTYWLTSSSFDWWCLLFAASSFCPFHTIASIRPATTGSHLIFILYGPYDVSRLANNIHIHPYAHLFT